MKSVFADFHTIRSISLSDFVFLITALEIVGGFVSDHVMIVLLSLISRHWAHLILFKGCAFPFIVLMICLVMEIPFEDVGQFLDLLLLGFGEFPFKHIVIALDCS
jgi:hypothetical protein